jgi:hypothetical protein
MYRGISIHTRHTHAHRHTGTHAHAQTHIDVPRNMMARQADFATSAESGWLDRACTSAFGTPAPTILVCVCE